MSVNEQIPDYDLDEMVVVTASEQQRALANPLRSTLLELLFERAARRSRFVLWEVWTTISLPKSAYCPRPLVRAPYATLPSMTVLVKGDSVAATTAFPVQVLGNFPIPRCCHALDAALGFLDDERELSAPVTEPGSFQTAADHGCGRSESLRPA
jgi:hypothetical protein